MSPSNRTDHIRLTSHPVPGAKHEFPIVWGAPTARERGPIIGTVSRPQDRNVIGTHGGSYAVYRALAVSSGALDPIRRPDLTNTYPAATIGPFEQWIDPQRIVALDPWGHLVAENFRTEIAEGTDIRPSIAITRARLDLPEIQAALAAKRLVADGEFVHASGSVSVVKIAIDPVWYLPGIAQRFGTSENNLRRALFEQTAGMFPELVTRSDLQVFLPPVGGTTVYLFGDVTKLPDHRTKITCRVHDECNGSDVFGSDICTCRPYLIQGIEECARAGQTGGLGVIVYNRKEGRALGEVTKFLVYNARKRQQDGDDAAAYFERTECVAGVQDARFQQLMPDVIHWLGLKRIDRFISMSDMKYDALTDQGVEIVERVPIPDDMIPADAHVEMAAKKAAGYFAGFEAARPEKLGGAVARKILMRAGPLTVTTDASPDDALSLLNAGAVRHRAHRMLEIGLNGGLEHFRVDLDRLDETVERVLEITRKAYPAFDVPFHSRWRHFVVGGVDRWAALADGADWRDASARARAEFDLAMVSVFLDAGAGASWRFHDSATDEKIGRSEGLALASLDMFARGAFSAKTSEPLRADAAALERLTVADLRDGFQVTDSNPLVGLEGRVGLLRRLGQQVSASPEIFSRQDAPRPGGLFDHLAALAERGTIDAPTILSELLRQLGPIWPSRLVLGGIPLGDCWRHPALKTDDATSELMPLHKLSQWLSYSLIEPLQRAGLDVSDIDGLTGLAEYRNGGLFVDSGVLVFRNPDDADREHDVASTLVVEWRALTVALLDRLADSLRRRVGLDAVALPLAKILEGGTWATGRAMAFARRGDGSPPVKVVSDGTVF